MDGQGDTQSDKPSSIRWSKSDQELIVEWLETRNRKMELVNLDSYQTGNHTRAAQKMLNDFGLFSKKGVSAHKVSDKIRL